MADEQEPTAGAEAQMQMLEHVIEEGMGVSFRGGARDDGYSNEEIIRFLAQEDKDGNPSTRAVPERIRDIRPDQDQEKEAANQYLETIDKRLETIGKTSKGKDVDPDKQANAAAVAALRKAGKHVAKSMQSNLEQMRTTSGPRAGGTAKEVTPEYAAQRRNSDGVAESAIYVKTGQLSQALINGKLKIEKTSDSIKSLLEARKAAE